MTDDRPPDADEGHPDSSAQVADRNFVLALQKGLDALICFDRQHVRLTLSDVARLTRVSPASARRSLYTLAKLGYLETDGKRYWMAPRVLLVAHSYVTSRPISSLAQPLLDTLSDLTRESASLGQLVDADAIIVARSTARRSLSTGLCVGSRLPVHASALGRTLLVGLDPDEAARRVRAMPRDPLTPRTICDAASVLAEVERCRALGHAESDGESTRRPTVGC